MSKKELKNKKILTVAAHPDDEILGCGGTIARMVNEGYKAYTLILGEGITARDLQRGDDNRKKETDELKEQVKMANKIVGVTDTFHFDLPDNRLDTVPLLDVIKIIENVKNRVKPDIVFTHFCNDLNIDHQIIYKAVLTATRPLQNETVKEIYAFETMSSTEWAYPLSFSPNYFFDISETIDTKLRALKEYKGEMRAFPHPRSLKAVKLQSQMLGVDVGIPFAEAFQVVRSIK